MALTIVSFGLSFSASSTRSMMLQPNSSNTNPSSSSIARRVSNIQLSSSTSSDNAAALVSNNNNINNNNIVDNYDDESIVRRSGNYPPSMWDYDFFQSLTTHYQGESCSVLASDLKENVRMLLNKEDTNSLRKLELIDTIQRLGVSCHFEDDIKTNLEAICNSADNYWHTQDLYATSLKFRLFRQHCLKVPQDVFKDYMNESGTFKASLSKDMKGVLSLYEASYLATKNEKIMDEAQDFTKKHMKDYMININSSEDEQLGKLISHALEVPLHWREPRQEARWFIDFFQTSTPVQDDMDNSCLLDFAKLDYNMVQSIYQDDLKHLSRWWKDIQWEEKLSFARQRIMECFYWSVGYNPKPEFGYGRRVLTALTAFITTIDDIYDVYATLEELELLTKLTKRWNAAELDQLPEYMKICFTDFYSEINNIANDAQREHDVDILPYIQKVWTDLFEAYLLEAKWYHSGYKPSLSEYLDNAWISITGPIILTHSYFLTKNCMTDEALQCLMSYPNIVRLAATILRLADDMGTSSHEIERGDNPKSIQCYMNDNGVSEEEAREHIKILMSEKWKELNEERLIVQPFFSKPFIEMCFNLARISISMYLYGDGHGVPGFMEKQRISSLFVNPVPV